MYAITFTDDHMNEMSVGGTRHEQKVSDSGGVCRNDDHVDDDSCDGGDDDDAKVTLMRMSSLTMVMKKANGQV